jgi:hypothetical protein
MAMQKPHEFVLDQVQRKWSGERSKGFFTKLIELGEVKAIAIDILETENFDEEHMFCTGEILNRWRYDDTGLRYIPKNENVDQNIVEYCEYNIHYFSHGELYEIVESNGVEDFKVIGIFIE